MGHWLKMKTSFFTLSSHGHDSQTDLNTFGLSFTTQKMENVTCSSKP
ncbi:hypothetical protein GBAR_LOCUS14180 [Geodia barretti]|uniref:Uncharacterized protein n=1 Tax=Geodia barretti TaxID=519541 RepID=A0AA35S6L3_GEOBA|nr:hypothetical protein GBAR_LOCUS14180 [Geodia barretti]